MLSKILDSFIHKAQTPWSITIDKPTTRKNVLIQKSGPISTTILDCNAFASPTGSIIYGYKDILVGNKFHWANKVQTIMFYFNKIKK
jgi:hypothetical protein